MGKGGKIAVTVIVIILFLFITGLLTAADISKTFIALMGIGLIFGLQAMWKKPKQKSNTSTEIKLDKTNSVDENEKTT